MDHTGLEQADIDHIKQVFSRFPEIEKAILYGSRAKGNYRPASDIDLTLVGDTLGLTLLNTIETELDDLLLPCKIDLSDFSKISDPDLISHTYRVGKEFYNRH